MSLADGILYFPDIWGNGNMGKRWQLCRQMGWFGRIKHKTWARPRLTVTLAVASTTLIGAAAIPSRMRSASLRLICPS